MRSSRLVTFTVGLALAAAVAAEPASAAWRLAGVSRVPTTYGQGIAFDRATGGYFFSGLSSLRNSSLTRTGPSLRPLAVRYAVLPRTPEGYNHAGDIGLDPARRRVLLSLECFYPFGGGNPCASGAIGVADPRTLAFRYHVNLDRAQIAKAMWVEPSPDGRWVWTSSGRRLLAYRAADVRPGAPGPIAGRDLGPVLASSAVTGATFAGSRLFLSLNRGTYFQVVSYAVGVALDGLPLVVGPPRREISVTRSPLNDEPEGLAMVGRTLRWQMAPARSFHVRVLAYAPT